MKEWFLGLEERERWFVAAGAAALALFLIYILVVGPLYSSAAARAERVATKQQDFEWMQRVAARVKAQGPSVAQPDETIKGNLVVIVDRTARSAGLGPSLKTNQPTGPNSIRVRLDAAPFDALVRWLGDLHTNYQIDIQSATFDGGNTPGVVNASVILERPSE